MTPLLAAIDPWILAFSAITVVVTVWMGFRSAKTSKTASDFFVAGRSVSVGWNASAISGEYLSAASFMGVAGMVMSSGYDALWYPVCYACGYLFLLLFIAGPLRRFGAYTIPDFAEGRFDSPLFRKIAVVFVLFIGFFYTMPQMKGAGTTLAYVFQDVDLRGGWLEFLAPHSAAGEAIKGFPYSAGVLIVGAVITLNVALGGMKGITLVQAFQYWMKMFAISVPVFVLMAVYGDYGSHVGASKIQTYDLAVVSNGTTNHTKQISGTDHLTRTLLLGDESIAINRKILPEKAPADATWLNPFGPLTTKAAKAAKPKVEFEGVLQKIELTGEAVLRELAAPQTVGESWQETISRPAMDVIRACALYLFEDNAKTAGASFVIAYAPSIEKMAVRYSPTNTIPIGGRAKDIVPVMEKALLANGIHFAKIGATVTAFPLSEAKITPIDPKPYSLLYTYSLIIALVCGTAGLPHILVRFYTNPDGVAAKRTTMWVMILIGVFYVFPPVFGVIGRNLLPELYSGVGAKGTDKIVLELPRILNEGKVGKWESEKVRVSTNAASLPPAHSPTGSLSASPATGASKGIPWGSILSGITCAGAFAAFMSTFSGLLVSMTGALAHDVYGRMLNPKASPEQRMKMFKWCAVLVGGVAVLLGSQVEPLEINFMVGQAFAIAAASYFPLLFMAVWWRKLTMKGAATGMLTGGLSALIGISLTSFSTLAVAPGKTGELFAVFKPLNDFWATHPLLRILCEQPAIWAVPMAITLMFIVSKLTSKDVPEDIRMKMLVLHAPEKLGLKQEYIQEHQLGH